MLKKISRLSFTGLFGMLLLTGCQRDDICPNTVDTTPQLIIRFYDAEAPEEPKAPTDLSIRAVNNDTILYYRISRDSIAIPLQTSEDGTEYLFTIDAPEINEDGEIDPDDEDISNTDIISFLYAREEIYINRACAFKVNYLDLKVAIDDGDDEGRWVETYFLEQTTIENEANAHLSIYH